MNSRGMLKSIEDEQFKRVAQKDMRKYSNIVEGSIRRYVQSKI